MLQTVTLANTFPHRSSPFNISPGYNPVAQIPSGKIAQATNIRPGYNPGYEVVALKIALQYDIILWKNIRCTATEAAGCFDHSLKIRSTEHHQAQKRLDMYQDNNSLIEIVVSPDDHSKLNTYENLLSKDDQSLAFPNVNDIPWLFENPIASLNHNHAKILQLLVDAERQIAQYKKRLSAKEHSKKTKERIRSLIQAEEHNFNVVRKLLSPFLSYKPHQVDVLEALGARTAFSQRIDAYGNTVFRDWGRTEEEDEINHKALAFIESTLPGSLNFQTLVILGPGAGRLPIDFARHFKPKISIACDLNPMLLLMAQEMYRGQKIEFYEIPNIPKNFENSTVKSKLSMKGEPPQEFYFLLADALRLPFAKESADIVLTPWFIDIIHQDLDHFLGQLNRVISTGGHWISFGPLHFDSRDIDQKYSFDEIKIMAHKKGFEIEAHKADIMPYLASPASAYQRFDQVHCIVAKKVKDISPPSPYQAYLPEWILDPTQKIPVLDRFGQLSAGHKIRKDILDQVDGSRSIQDLSIILKDGYGMTDEHANSTILGFFTEIFEDELAKTRKGLG